MVLVSRISKNRRVLGCFSMNPKFITKYNCRYNSSITSTIPNLRTKAEEKIRGNVCSALKQYKATFPRDLESTIEINRYLNLQDSSAIRIGIIYENARIASNSKIIESILADPLSCNNKIWFNKISSRQRSQNNCFLYSSEVLNEKEDNGTSIKIPSPILSADYRPKLTYLSDTMKDLEIWEINDTSNMVQCHYYINIIENIQEYIENQVGAINKQCMITVVDNTDYSPSTESIALGTDKPKIIKVNSQLALNGIQKFLEYDTKATDEYLRSLKDSNINELSEIVTFYSNSSNLSSRLINDIQTRISRMVNKSNSLENLYANIKNDDISEFSLNAHSELQYKFIPNTTKFFKKLKWWKLYMKNDNIEYLLKDYFNDNFMNSSIESYNFVRGKIVSSIQRSSANYSDVNDIANPLLKLKNDVISQRIPSEIQPFVYSILTKNLINYQLPISIISFLSYQYFDFSSNSAIALALLGWVVGINHISKSWESFVKKWLNELFEDTRMCITKQCIDEGLSKELITKYEEELALTKLKKEILKDIQK